MAAMAGRHRRQDLAPAARRPRLLAIGAVVVVVVVLAIVLPLLLTGGDGQRQADSPTGAATDGRPAPTSATATTPGASSAPAATGSATAAPARGGARSSAPTLVVRADRGSSWLTVRDGRGRQRFNGLLHRGQRQRFDGPVFSVVIGDAGAVDVQVDGAHRRRGRPGQVERFTVRRD